MGEFDYLEKRRKKMRKIRILSDQEAKKIAAGEVVERPASVVKELVENSLDAGASKISLYVEKAGKKLIRVVDNGNGMHPDDARLCFHNHATSKVISIDELENVGTFGFRGEALAAISSVSKVTLNTRFSSYDDVAETGIKLYCVDGKFVEDEVVACSPGTEILVQDLFYNTPVRKKFLKQDETEWNQIKNLFYAFCLSNLDVHFQLYTVDQDDKTMVLNAPPAKDLKDRAMQIWGHNFSQNLVELAQDDKGPSVRGLISNHNFWRYGRQQIFFFVNSRWVKHADLSRALMKGYRNVLPPARFPAVFLFIDVEPAMVDINVHPRKEEVRFVKPGVVLTKVQMLVTKTLESLINRQLGGVVQPVDSAPEVLPSNFVPAASEVSPIVVQEGQVPDESSSIDLDPPPSSVGSISSPYATLTAQSGITAGVVPPTEGEVAPLLSQRVSVDEVVNVAPRARIIGQLFNTYIIVENDDGLLLIDQHAAHERILYEKYLKNFEQKDGTRLLFPEVITLGEKHLAWVLKEAEFLKRQGIEVEQIGEREVAIKTSPPKVQSQSLQELIFEMIEFMEEHEEALDTEVFRKKLNEHVHSQLACKMAIKAGDKLSHEMMENIVTQLQEVDNRFICVHGRPTTWSVSKLGLEKRFRRK